MTMLQERLCKISTLAKPTEPTWLNVWRSQPISNRMTAGIFQTSSIVTLSPIGVDEVEVAAAEEATWAAVQVAMVQQGNVLFPQ